MNLPTVMGMSGRLEAVRAHLARERVRAALFTAPESIQYLTGFRALIYSRPIAVHLDANAVTLIVPVLECDHAATARADRIATYGEAANADFASFDAVLDDLMRAVPCWGFEPEGLTFQRYLEVSQILQSPGRPLGNLVGELRLVKDDGEIALIRAASALADLGMQAELAASQPGVSELEVAVAGDRTMVEAGARLHPEQPMATISRPIAGLRTTQPHALTSGYRLAEGDVVLHQTSVCLGGYWSECERAMGVGELPARARKAFEAMRRAGDLAIAWLRPGVSGDEVDRRTQALLEEAGYSCYLLHRAGHGIGLAIHEGPYLAAGDRRPLAAGMVVTVEPGLYLPGVGGFRHSDTVLITDNGAEPLTAFTRDRATMEGIRKEATESSR
ncbi:MAG: Xaa-Pro peptidase family protein [Bacillota bacterium]